MKEVVSKRQTPLSATISWSPGATSEYKRRSPATPRLELCRLLTETDAPRLPGSFPSLTPNWLRKRDSYCANMTDCNDNQLVVKVQIENDHAAAQDRLPATADQPTAPQPAPDAPSITSDQPARAEPYRDTTLYRESINDCAKCLPV